MHPVGTAGGCSLLLKTFLSLSGVNVTIGENGCLICDFSLFAKVYRNMCVYAPNKCSEREYFFSRLSPFLETERRVILLGDFNCACSVSERASGNDYIDKSAISVC